METITINGKQYQLDIDKAKEQGLLKEQDNKVRSWEEFKEKYKDKYGYMLSIDRGAPLPLENPITAYEQLTDYEAKALTAFSKLLKLRRDWVGEWEPDWKNMNTSYGVIWVNKNELQANTACVLARSLSFPNYKMAQEFLNTFRDLIEEAKTLI